MPVGIVWAASAAMMMGLVSEYGGGASWHVVTLVSVTAAQLARRGGRRVGRRIESRVEIDASLETLIG